MLRSGLVEFSVRDEADGWLSLRLSPEVAGVLETDWSSTADETATGKRLVSGMF